MGAGPLPERCACPCGGGSEQMAEGILPFGLLVSTHKSGPPGSLDGPDMRDVPGVVSWLTQDGPRSHCHCRWTVARCAVGQPGTTARACRPCRCRRRTMPRKKGRVYEVWLGICGAHVGGRAAHR